MSAAAANKPSPTSGMTIAQRILHVGGRNNAAGYVEFGSTQAVEALVRQVLRDLPDATGAAQVPSLPSAEQLGKDVAKWTGFEFTGFRGDTGAAEQRVNVSVERLGYAVEAVVKAALSQPSQQGQE